jgi:hypothetical protein
LTDPSKTLIAALLDRSGSMERSKQATEDGWREMINEQRQLLGRCDVTLAQFDTDYEMVYSAIPISDVPEFVLRPRGRTALLDAIGKFVTEIGEQLAALSEDQRPGQVVCLIMTDGMENASQEWDWKAVKELTTRQQDQWDWKFIFIGANMDAIEVGDRMGFAEGYSISYDDSSYACAAGVMRSARELIRRTREGDDGAFSDEDRQAAMSGPEESAR